MLELVLVQSFLHLLHLVDLLCVEGGVGILHPIMSRIHHPVHHRLSHPRAEVWNSQTLLQLLLFVH